jgi:hypothetical protein
MVRIEGSTYIDRPVEEVFDFVADERNEPAYNPRLSQVHKVSPGPIGSGTEWTALVESRGRPLPLDLRVTHYLRPREIGSSALVDGAGIEGELRFSPEDSGTRLRWAWEIEPHGALRLIGPLLGVLGRRQEERVCAALRDHLEQRALSERGAGDVAWRS